MFRIVLFCLIYVFATSIAKRRNDWVLTPVAVLPGIEEATSLYWDYRNNRLYFVAPSAQMIVSWNPTTNTSHEIGVNGKPVFAFPTEDPSCIVVGFDDEIKKIVWDGMRDKKKEESLAKINDAGKDAKILAGSVSYNGNLTFIVKGKEKNNNAWFLYTMQLDQKPFKINVDRRGYFKRPLDGVFWTCMPPNIHLSSSADALVYRTRYNQKLGITLNSGKQSWNSNYMPVGESKEDTLGNTYQIMDYKNGDANVIQTKPKSKLADFAVSKVKVLTSGAWGGADLSVFYVGSKKTNKDKNPSAGGIFSCNTIGATGRPAFLATSSLNPEVNYCETPKPNLTLNGIEKGLTIGKGGGTISIRFNFSFSL